MAKTMLSNLAAIAQNTQSSNIRMIDIDDLHPSPDNFFEVRNIPEFAATILGQGGVKDNLLVTPLESGGYEIISGHRRTAAVRYLLDNGKAISRLLPCLVQSYDNGTDKQLDLILCNVATRQISDQELWRSYEELNSLLKERKEAGEKFGSIRDYLANLLHVSAAQVSKMQNVTHNAIEPVKEAVANGDLSIHAANEIAKLPEEQQEELAAGDLSEVTPKQVKKKKSATSSNFSDEAAPTKPVTMKWDGETHFKIVKKQLMHLVNDNLREAALTQNGMDFFDVFRKENKTVGIGYETGIFTHCSYDRISISFSEPAKYNNIQNIEITWQKAARYVQEWIRSEAEKDATSSIFSEDTEDQSDSTESQENDGQFTFTGDAKREPQEIEVKDELTDRPHEDAEKVVSVLKHQHRQTMIGYLTLTLQAMGMNAETISDAQLMMYQVLDTKSDAEAREAYRGA